MKQKEFKSVKQYLATLAIAICCATLPGDRYLADKREAKLDSLVSCTEIG